MDGYGWTAYDPRVGGSQTIHDAGNKIDITTDLYKTPGGRQGGSWGVRVKGVPRPDAPPDLKTTVIFYMAMEDIMSDWAARLRCDNNADETYDYGVLECHGYTPSLGDFKLFIQEPEENQYPMTFVNSVTVSEDRLWQAKGRFDCANRQYPISKNLPPT